jgi:membrane protein
MRQPIAGPAPGGRKLAEIAQSAGRARGLSSARAGIGVLVRTVRLYLDDHCGTYSAAIAFYAIFSLVPLSLITVSFFGLLVEERRIVQFIFDQLPLEETPTTRDNVETVVSRASEVSAAGLGVGLLALMWSASGIFSALRRGLNRAMGRRDPRPFWRGKLMDVALIPSLGLLALLTIFGTTVVQIAVEQAERLGPASFDTSALLRFGTFVVTSLIALAAFALLYRYLPNPQPGWRQAATSAAFAMVLFEIVRVAASAFFQFTPFNRDTALYASFGTVLTILLWIFINASIVLLGAEFGRAVRGAGLSKDRATATFVKPFR